MTPLNSFKRKNVAIFGLGLSGKVAAHMLLEAAADVVAFDDNERSVALASGEGTALLGCDVWEHSYYLDFRNRRPDYVQNWLDNLANYDAVSI